MEITRRNVILRLRELDQNILADLAPQRGARYGKIDTEDKRQLVAVLAEMHMTMEAITAPVTGAAD